MNAPRCSDGSAVAGEQPAGSAPLARAWVGLEQDGPWGAKAFTASHLDEELGALIEKRAAAESVRPVLLRRPGRHPAPGAATERHVVVAHTAPGASWLLTGTVAHPAELAGLDWAAAAAGDADLVVGSLPALAPTPMPLLLVCTNGTRDVCCAVTGRPLAAGVARSHPDQVWEVTHTSGHRFAPTAVLLPAGTLHGRLDVAGAAELLDAALAGHTVLEGHRGRSTWPPAGQVAELAVREALGDTRIDAVAVHSVAATGAHTWTVELTTTASEVRERSRWRVVVHSEDAGVERPESCAKSPVPMRRWRTDLQAV